MRMHVQFIEQNNDFTIDVKDTADEFDLRNIEDVQIIEAPTDPYDGEYDVTPSAENQTLDTTGKRLNDDINVLPIPFSKTSNTSGGYTVTIGG